MAKKKKYYVVWQGHRPGIYESWSECQAQVTGYPDAVYKSFKTREEAEEAFGMAHTDHIGTGERKPKPKPTDRTGVVLPSFSVDAACSGNPGDMEYRGVWTEGGEELFRIGPYRQGTNNVGEFLALVHALAFFQKTGTPDIPIYSDSRIAMGWVRKGKCNTKLKRTPANRPLFDLIRRAEAWLATHKWKNPLLKWETSKWGEIPADFGRK